MHKPHGGKLINRVLNETERNKLSERLDKLYCLKITEELTQDVFNIATGVYSPLEGFVGREDYINILDNRRLASGAKLSKLGENIPDDIEGKVIS